MDSALKESYVLRHLSLIDMERALRSLDLLDNVTDKHLREALFRDAVTCYAKPFSGNRGLHTRKGLRIGNKGIPKELKPTHMAVIDLRNQLFAHMDLDRQRPHVDVCEINGKKHFSFSVVGYETVYAKHFVGPLKSLAKAVHAHLMNELRTIEESHV